MGVFNLQGLINVQEDYPTPSEYKRVMLTAYLAVICMVVAVLYATLDISNDVYYSMPAYGALLLIPTIGLWMIRNRNYKVAKVTLMVAGNFVVFWVAITDPLEAGAFLFFIPVGIGSFAIFAFDDYRTSFALAAFTVFLFLLAFFGDIHPAVAVRPTELYIKLSFVINYFISLTISVLSLYFLMKLNQISETHLIEKENFAIQKNAELQKVNEELDRFVYSVSHDLRSPLSSILGLTNLARLSKDRDELNQILMMIQGRVNAQDHFIKEIIDYSRNARTETILERIPLREIISDTVDALRYNHNADKIDFRITVADDITLMSDRIRLTVVLSNLIGNAVKYHDLTKENPFIEIGYHRDQYAIYVQDNGIGVMPEHQEKIFNMFYRGSDRSTGSGLGLFITKEVVEKLGGTITLQSRYAEGSTFIVFLPVSAVQ